METEVITDAKVKLVRTVYQSDADWFEEQCEHYQPYSLFRRMREAFEQSLESGSVSGGINGVQTQPGRVDANPAKQP